MNTLLEFRKWAQDIGHYAAIAAVDRYLALLKLRAEREKQDE